LLREIALAMMLPIASKNANKASVLDINNTDKGNNIRELLRYKRLLALSSINIATAILMALLGASFIQLALSYNISMGVIGLLLALNNGVIGIIRRKHMYWMKCTCFKGARRI
jgi:hypothetical protein